MRVCYLIHTDNPEVIAYFPEEIFDSKGNKASYQHTGQHGACSEEYAKECRDATPDEYEALEKELTELVGYDNLRVEPFHKKDMDLKVVKSKLEELDVLKDFKWNDADGEIENLYATLTVENRHFKKHHPNGRKDEYKLGSFYSIYVAHMYKGEGRQFFYLILYRKGEKREYRRHSFYPVEYNKVFASGVTVERLIEDFKEKTIGYELK